MKNIYNKLFLGTQNDYEDNKDKILNNKDWVIIQACKEPYHRQALGYKGRAVEKTHHEYLHCIRDNRLILNLIDTDNVEYVSKPLIDLAMRYINEALKSKKNVLLHCNKGMSRSPIIALLYLNCINAFEENNDFKICEKIFKEQYYEKYNPANGFRDFAIKNWEYYSKFYSLDFF